MQPHRLLPLPALVLSLFAGCAAHRETVRIESYPPGAVVHVNGEERGTTPLEVELETRRPHSLRMERTGFVAEDLRLVPVQNPAKNGLLRFGPRVQSGYYQTFSPNPVAVTLRSTLVPPARGMGGLGAMAERVRTADAMLEEGAITAEDHGWIVQQIIEAYQ
ncbi:MAG: PEGA domain-containing protein [Opitutales bacterium]|nr:PEGA domain-containing protein [Opitutales bacterium]